MAKFLKLVDKSSEWSGKFVSFFTIAAIAIVLLEVIGRYGFKHSFLFSHDMLWFWCGALYILGGAYCLYHKGHVNIDVVYGRFQPRTRGIIDLITFPFFGAFCGLLLWQGAIGFWASFKGLEATVTPWGGPVWLLKLTIPVGAFLILLQGLAKFIRDLNLVIRGQ